jgi:hypothetical protein
MRNPFEAHLAHLEPSRKNWFTVSQWMPSIKCSIPAFQAPLAFLQIHKINFRLILNSDNKLQSLTPLALSFLINYKMTSFQNLFLRNNS